MTSSNWLTVSNNNKINAYSPILWCDPMTHSKFDQFAYGNSSQLHRPVKYIEQVSC